MHGIEAPFFSGAVPPEHDLALLTHLLEGVTRWDETYLRARPNTPAVYSGAVRFGLIPGIERYQVIPVILTNGYGDCDGLAAWRAAELRLMGYTDARAVITRQWDSPAHFWKLHAYVLYGGMTEDPSDWLIRRGLVVKGQVNQIFRQAA